MLLLEAMKEAGVAALGRFVLAGKEKLCLIRPMGDALALETLFVHEDVKDHAEIDEAVAGAEVREPELELAKQIIASLAGAVRARRSCAASTASRCASCSRRSSRATRSRLPGPEAPAPVVDLMEALRASVAAASKKQPARRAKKKAAPRKRAAASK